MNSLKLRRIGDALVVSIPDAVLDRYNLKEGDNLDLDSLPEGFILKPIAPDPVRESASRVMNQYGAVLKRLAK